MRGHLDEAGLAAALRERPEQVAEEAPAADHGILGVGGLEALQRRVELGLAQQVVEAARLAVDADPVPPEAPQLREVAVERDPALEQVGHPALVAVEAGLDRDVGKPAVAAEQLRQRMGARPSRAADEDDVAVLRLSFGSVGAGAGGPAHAGWCS